MYLYSKFEMYSSCNVRESKIICPLIGLRVFVYYLLNAVKASVITVLGSAAKNAMQQKTNKCHS